MSRSEFDRIRQAFIEDVLGIRLMAEELDVVLESYSVEEPDTMQQRDIISDRMSAPMPEVQASRHLVELIDGAKQSMTLGAYIREKAHRHDMVTFRPALFGQGQISRDYWSRLLNNEISPSKEKLLRVAVLLRLSAEEAEEMLEKAGYSMSPTILRDVVVEYCLQHQYYDFVGIEQLLADNQIQSLFNDRRGS